MTKLVLTCTGVCLGVLLTGGNAVWAECVPRTYCEIANIRGMQIFRARVLHPIDDGFTWRVHVTRSLLGETNGDVEVYVNSGGEYISPAKLEVGSEYLLVLKLDWTLSDRRILNNGLGCGPPAIRWNDLHPADRAYLEGLSGAQPDGRIFGDIDLSEPSDPDPLARWRSLANIRVRLRRPNGAPLAVATTDQQGHYEFRGLSAGDYRVTADLSRRQFRLDHDGDDGNATLLPHACQDVSLLFKRRDSQR